MTDEAQESNLPLFIIEEPKYSQIPNVLLDNIDKFDPVEFKVLMVICRSTFGYHTKKFTLSISQLLSLTGYKKRDVIVNALNSLQKKKLIRKAGKKSRVDVYELIVHNSNTSVTNGDHIGHQQLPIETKEKERSKEREYIYINKINKPARERETEKKPLKLKFSENVEMTERDYQKLIEKYGNDLVKVQLEEYDRWKYNNAVTCDDYRGLNNWLKKHELKTERLKTANAEIITKNLNWLKNHIQHLSQIGARGNLQFNETEVYDSVLNKRFKLNAKNMIDEVKSWDKDRRW
jgi:hypothetical protein